MVQPKYKSFSSESFETKTNRISIRAQQSMTETKLFAPRHHVFQPQKVAGRYKLSEVAQNYKLLNLAESGNSLYFPINRS